MAKFVPTVPPDDATLEQLDAEHDGVHVFRGPERAPFCYVVRRPTPKELSTYAAECKRGKTHEANRLLLLALAVYPDRAAVDQQITRWPASAGACLSSDAFTEFYGGVLAEHQK
jgi:hypothetical protein